MKRKEYAEGVTDANYLFMKLVGNRTKGEAPTLPKSKSNGCFVLHENEKDGRTVVIGCPSYPELSNSDVYLQDFDGMEPMEIVEEMCLNGMGSRMSFTDNAYIRVLDSEGKPDPVVFRDLKDALAYVGA